MTRSADLLFRILVVIVLLVPLPFGGHRPWVWGVVAMAAGGLLLAWTVLGMRGTRLPSVPKGTFLPCAIPFFIALSWGVIQALPDLGPPHPLWAESASALPGIDVGRFVSIDPDATLLSVIRLLSIAGFFWLTVHLARNTDRAEWALAAVVIATTAYAVYGLTMHFAGLEMILWYPKDAYLGAVTGTFVNRNAFGAFAGLGVLTAMALAIAAVNQSGRTRSGLRDMLEILIFRAGGYVVCFAIMATALMLSESRGALLSTLAAIFVLIVLLMAGKMLRYRAAAAFVAILMVCGGVVMAISADTTVDRLLETTDHQGDRAQLYRLSTTAILDAPMAGHGLGAFASSFRIYRDLSLPRPVIYDFAHNIYLEVLMDLGVIAGTALLLSIAVPTLRCAVAVRVRRRRQHYPALAVSAAALVGLHGIVDFSIQIMGVGLIFALLLGIGVAQSWRTDMDHVGTDDRE